MDVAVSVAGTQYTFTEGLDGLWAHNRASKGVAAALLGQKDLGWLRANGITWALNAGLIDGDQIQYVNQQLGTEVYENAPRLGLAYMAILNNAAIPKSYYQFFRPAEYSLMRRAPWTASSSKALDSYRGRLGPAGVAPLEAAVSSTQGSIREFGRCAWEHRAWAINRAAAIAKSACVPSIKACELPSPTMIEHLLAPLAASQVAMGHAPDGPHAFTPSSVTGYLEIYARALSTICAAYSRQSQPGPDLGAELGAALASEAMKHKETIALWQLLLCLVAFPRSPDKLPTEEKWAGLITAETQSAVLSVIAEDQEVVALMEQIDKDGCCDGFREPVLGGLPKTETAAEHTLVHKRSEALCFLAQAVAEFPMSQGLVA